MGGGISGRGGLGPQRRNTLRWAGHDYQGGAYFITAVTQGRRHLFGSVVDGAMRRSDAGEMVARRIEEIDRAFAGVASVDIHVVMPNHIHAIIVVRADPQPALRRVEGSARPPIPQPTAGPRLPSGAQHPGSLPAIMQWLKAMTTRDYMAGVESLGWPPFEGRLWQRGYHDRVLRDGERERARAYILANPAQWHEDPENPDDI